MEILITLAGGMIILGLILSLEGVTSKKLDKKIKGRNVSMPDLSLMFGNRKKRK